MLSKSAATNVVQEIGKLVNKHINMMNTEGVIIASTDCSRIGQSHWGAEQIIHNSLDELYITEEDVQEIKTNDYVQAGLNLPLKVNDEIVGVIGITGQLEEVAQIGQIVKKMGEILLTEQARMQKLVIDKQAFELFIHNYLNFQDTNYSQDFIKQASLYGFNLRADYIIISFRENYSLASNNETAREKITCIANNIISSVLNKSILIEKNADWLILIPKMRQDQDSLKSKLRVLCSNLYVAFKKDLNTEFRFGISSTKNSNTAPNNILKQSNQALVLANINQLNIVFYDDIGLENIIFFLPKHLKKNLLADFFGDLAEDEKNEFINLFKTYIKHEGSITSIADEMFIHSNTVQYRLNKFANLTGHDIRKVSQTHLFYVAILLVQENQYFKKLSEE